VWIEKWYAGTERGTTGRETRGRGEGFLVGDAIGVGDRASVGDSVALGVGMTVGAAVVAPLPHPAATAASPATARKRRTEPPVTTSTCAEFSSALS
jgi:hypothetical protein